MNISTNQVLHLYVGTAVKTDTTVAGAKPKSFLKITQADGAIKRSPLFSEVVSTQTVAGSMLKKNKTTMTAQTGFSAAKGSWYALSMRYGGFSIEDSNVITVSYQAASDGDDVVKALGDLLKAQVDKYLVNEKGVAALTVATAAKSVSVTDEDPMYNPARFDVNNIKCLSLELSSEEIVDGADVKLEITSVDSTTANGAKYACMEHFAKGERGGRTNYKGWPFYHEVGEYQVDPTKKYDATIYHCRYYGDIQDYHSTDFDVVILSETATKAGD